MIFASNLFLYYFLPLALAAYLITPPNYRNLTALLASVLFYAWGAPIFIFILLAACIFDFFLANAIAKADKTKSKWLLAIGITSNLGLLVYFKYANFFVENLNAMLQQIGMSNVAWTAVALPLGISFFSFQKMSYLVDVKRAVQKPLQKLSDYLLYVLFFPQLVAGPIVRYKDIADQIHERSQHENPAFRLSGFWRFALGLGRKVLIANPMAIEVDKIFKLAPENLNTPLAWLGPLAFAFVVYHDFAGYSDMALGLGRMMGFKIPENFDNPYASGSITEFWQRWHISLTSWFRTYVFYPLRRFAKHKWGLYINLWIVFLLTGFWHGAQWTFILFGAWHGFWITLEHLFLKKQLDRLPRILQIFWTFSIVVVGCVLFKAADTKVAFSFFTKMFAFDFGLAVPYYEDLQLFFNRKFWALLGLAAIFSFAGGFEIFRQRQASMLGEDQPLLRSLGITLVAIVVLILSMAELATMGFQPFIYYTF